MFTGLHYDNTSMQYTANFNGCKMTIYIICFYSFLSFDQNIDCGYKLEPPNSGGSIEYPQSIYVLE